MATMRPFSRAIKKNSFAVTPMTHVQYVESRPRNKLIYQRALERLNRRGLQPKDGELKCFVKAEKLNLTAKADPDPRIISPRSPAYNIVVGSFILPLEHILYKQIEKLFGSPTVMKGYNAKQMGNIVAEKWHRLSSSAVAVGFDVHRMDQHVSRPMLEWEHSIYRKYNMPNSVSRALRKQLLNVGRMDAWDGYLKFAVEGRRASGDVNTGLGNCLIMCSAVYSALHEVKYDYYLINNGDDCVLFVDKENWPDAGRRLRAVLEALCLPTEFEDPVDELEKVVFCQMQPVFDGSDWLMVRDPQVCLSKDACTLKPLQARKSWNTYRASNSLCGLAAYGHLPVFKAFYGAIGRGAGKRVDRDKVEDGLKRMSKGLSNASRPITDAARVSFYTAFGITPQHQRAIERHYDQLRPCWADPHLPRMTPPEGSIGGVVGCRC